MRESRVTGPIFYDGIVNCVSYVNNILPLFFAQLSQEEKVYGFLQQDSAATHKAYVNFEFLREIFTWT